jgi:uncharacterized protein YdhG (YjbR/CyaY superfamily)
VPRPKFANVEEYLAAQPAASRAVLEKVRAAIRKALPKAEEAISYQIPAFKLDGRVVIFFAGFQEHYSVYPAGPELVKAFAKELAPYESNGKGTIRFPLDGRVPVGLIGRIAKFRAASRAGAVTQKRKGVPTKGGREALEG